MQNKLAVSSIISINFPRDGKIRSRKVVKRSNAIKTSKYPSHKMAGRMLQCESEHESNAMRLLDANPAVLSFNEQPCEIVYQLDGVLHRHYPDLLVKEQHSMTLVEVKSSHDAKAPEVAQRTAFMTEALPKYGYRYQVMIAEDLARQPRLDNIKRLLRMRAKQVSAIDREIIRQAFQTHSSHLWSAFDYTQLTHISHLVLGGLLEIDLSQPISQNTIIHNRFN